MPNGNGNFSSTFPRDLASGVVVFLVALPLCLGIAIASGAQPIAGLLAGIVGGILVGVLSGSNTSVSGPAAGLTAVVAAQIVSLGSFQAFLLAVVLAGGIQIVLGLLRAGFLANFIPSSVIKGLLAAIGIILILKQIPHLFGHDDDPEGEMSFFQPDKENTLTELYKTLSDLNLGAALIGLVSVAILVVWGRWKPLKKSIVPAPLVVVVLGVALAEMFRGFGAGWAIGSSHLVQVPVSTSLNEFFNGLKLPDFTQIGKPAIYMAAFTLAAVASLETLLNLEAVDKLDPQQRVSPASRELIAQGVGNIASGLIGGLPVTSVIVRSSVNINAGGKTKLSAIIHGILLLSCVALLPGMLNMIPLSCLAAILIVTGAKLVSPALIRQMWASGRPQFIPFAATVVGIVLTDLLVGVIIGLAVSVAFILHSNLRRPIRRYVEKHLGGDVVHVVLANQVSFLNRAALINVLEAVPRGGHILLDAQSTDYIDPDVLELIREFKEQSAPARGIEVSLIGFKGVYQMEDQIQYVDYSTRDLQSAVTPAQVLQILKDGHERFRTGHRLTRDLGRQVSATAAGQHPFAVVLSCIDSRSPVELIFDLGVGDIFSIRIAGNVTSRKVLASAEYGCSVVGSKLLLVMGHTRCGAVGAAVKLIGDPRPPAEVTGCQHIDHIVADIQLATDKAACSQFAQLSQNEQEKFVDDVAKKNVRRVVQGIRSESDTLRDLEKAGRILIVGALYDVCSGTIEFLE